MKNTFILLLFFSIISCKTSSSHRPLFYQMKDFNIVAGNQFINKIESLNSIDKISIVDRNVDRNEFIINGVNIFNDTLKTDQPNNFSYLKYARETGINKEKLNEVLIIFNQIKVSEFIRKNDFYLFPVEKYALTKQNGYIYDLNTKMKVNDTLFVEEVYRGKIILKKRVDKNWFEYESEK